MPLKVTEDQVAWFRLRRSGLVTPFATAELACVGIAGVQAQILPAAGLALWNRTSGFTHAELERALYRDRTLIRLWGQRHTLHLYPSREWPLVFGALAQRETWFQRQLVQRGADPAVHRRIVRRIEKKLRERGTMTRDDVRAFDPSLDAEYVSSWGGVFSELCRRGQACHAEPEGGDGRFAHRAHWLPDLAWDPPDAEHANVELARRYLAAYGPASVRDFGYWRGARVGDAARWFAALETEQVIDPSSSDARFVLSEDVEFLRDQPPARADWPVRLLSRFEPMLLAHRDKTWIVDAKHYPRVWRPAGHIEGIALVAGRAAATWRYARNDRGVDVAIAPFGRLSAAVTRVLATRATGVAEYFGRPLGALDFRRTHGA